MMPDDIPHTDDKAKRKIHPRAKDCFIISLAPIAVFAWPDPDLVIVLLLIAFLFQPFGIWLGIYSLVRIRKDSSYCGKGYAITGIIISTLIVLAYPLAYIVELFLPGTI